MKIHMRASESCLKCMQSGPPFRNETIETISSIVGQKQNFGEKQLMNMLCTRYRCLRCILYFSVAQFILRKVGPTVETIFDAIFFYSSKISKILHLPFNWDYHSNISLKFAREVAEVRAAYLKKNPALNLKY